MIRRTQTAPTADDLKAPSLPGYEALCERAITDALADLEEGPDKVRGNAVAEALLAIEAACHGAHGVYTGAYRGALVEDYTYLLALATVYPVAHTAGARTLDEVGEYTVIRVPDRDLLAEGRLLTALGLLRCPAGGLRTRTLAKVYAARHPGIQAGGPYPVREV